MRRLMLALALLSTVALAQPAPGDSFRPPVGTDLLAQAGEEAAVVFPAFPKEGNLVKIVAEGPTSFDFFVDLESISVGADGVVRYTLVARSSGGAMNVTYEGMLCRDRERKVYAFGRSDGTWSAARDPKWQAIWGMPTNRAQVSLYASYFCPARIMVRNVEEAKKVLKAGGVPDPSQYPR